MCTELVVNIVNEYEGHSFITKDEILKLLDKKQIKIIDQQIDAIQETEFQFLSEIKKKNEPIKQIQESKPSAPKLSRDEEKSIKRKIQYLERDMEKLEVDSKVVEEKMADPAFYNDPSFNDENDRYQKMQSELDQKMTEWEEWVEKLG